MEQPRRVITLYGEKRLPYGIDEDDEEYASNHIQRALTSLTSYANSVSSDPTTIHSVSLSTHMYRTEPTRQIILIASVTIVYSGIIHQDFLDMYNIKQNQHTARVTI